MSGTGNIRNSTRASTGTNGTATNNNANFDTENINPLDMTGGTGTGTGDIANKMSMAKSDMSHVLNATNNATMNDGNDDNNILNGESLSFRHLISTVSQKQDTQSSVSLPFYFICLLHLANEKVCNPYKYE